MTDFAQLSTAERAEICQRVHRTIRTVGQCSATSIMLSSALSLSSVLHALDEMLNRGAVRRTEPEGNAPELWSVVPRRPMAK